MQRLFFMGVLVVLATSSGACKSNASEQAEADEAGAVAAEATVERSNERGKKAKNGKRNKQRGAKNKAPRTDEQLDAFADRVEALVLAGDVAGLRGLWLTPEQLAGCRVDTPDAADDAAVEFVQANLTEFDELAAKELGAGARGDKLFTNRHFTEKPKFMKGRLVGDGCSAKRFGRVNVIVELPGQETVVEHRFNAELMGDKWRLFRYLPNHPDCKTPAGRKHMGCKKLLAIGEPARADSGL